jgi:hypothetical protein
MNARKHSSKDETSMVLLILVIGFVLMFSAHWPGIFEGSDGCTEGVN